MTNPKHEAGKDYAGQPWRQSRRRLNLSSEVTTPAGQIADAIMLNISSSGLLLRTDLPLEVDEQIVVAVPAAGDRSATVIWASDSLFGCKFTSPLPVAALSAAQLESPAEFPGPAIPQSNQRGSAATQKEGFGSRLVRFRKRKSYTQGELAHLLGVSKTTVWKWEKDGARPRKSIMGRLASALGVTEEELLVGDMANQPAKQVNDAKSNLAATIFDAKQKIAEAAGTDASQVTVTIEI